MGTSALPEVRAARGVYVYETVRNCGAAIRSHNSVTFLNGSVACAGLRRSRKPDTLPTKLCRTGSNSGYACDGRNGDERPIHCRNPRTPGQHRASHVPLPLNTFPFTPVPAADADVTKQWRLEDEILELSGLQTQLLACKDVKEKTAVLDSNKRVRGVFGGIGRPGVYIKPSIALASRVVDEVGLHSLKSLVAIGQEHLLEWPSGLRDVYAVQGNSHPRSVSGSPVSLMKETFTLMGDVIERWEGSQENLWEIMRTLLIPWNETFGYLNSEEEAGCDSSQSCSDDTEGLLLESLHALIAVLVRLERFYDSIGGIVGYQLRVLELIKESEIPEIQTAFIVNGDKSSPPSLGRQFYVPLGPDLSRDKAYAMRAATWGLEV